MSEKHPIIAITGSSGAGTNLVTRTFEAIFRRENVTAAVIEGDSFHRYDRKEMKLRMAEAERAGDKNFSHFGPENNLFAELEQLFHSYAESGTGRQRKYLHNAEEAAPYKQEPGTFTPWERLPGETDLLFYEVLHGAVVTAEIEIARQHHRRAGRQDGAGDAADLHALHLAHGRPLRSRIHPAAWPQHVRPICR